MILLIFILWILFTGIFLYLGYSGNSFGLAYLGMFSLLLLGLFLYSDGLDIDAGMMESPIGSHNFVTTYETHTTSNDTIVNLLAATFFYIPIAGIFLTTFITLRQWYLCRPFLGLPEQGGKNGSTTKSKNR